MASSLPDVWNEDATEKTTVTLPPALRRIVLVGFMGAGKTTIGRLLAERLGWRFLDLDEHLEARVGATIPEVFSRHGEGHFRRLESSALANALGCTATVLALGGGTLEELTNRLLVEQTPGSHVVYLAAPFLTLYDRCMLQSFASSKHQRPVLSCVTEAERRFNLRHPLYTRLAKQTVTTAGLDEIGAMEAVLRGFTPAKAAPSQR